jgi:thiamine biosynthesis lipoprotein ApbE
MNDSIPMLDWTFRAMGADWRIHHGGGVSGEDAQVIAETVNCDELLWSRFLPQSDVTKITQGAGRPVRVDHATVELIAAVVDWSERIGAALRAWGYQQSVGSDPPARPPVTRAIEGSIEFDRDAATITIPVGTQLDLGGIGKSWAAVRAGAVLAELVSDQRLIIDAGGDLTIVRGDHRIETVAGAVVAREGTGVATSSSERRQWQLGDGSVSHHLIDPISGAPSERGTAVVAGVDPVSADVWASCVVLDPAYLERLEVPAARISVAGAVTTNALWETIRA